jgi:hypothetical protein
MLGLYLTLGPQPVFCISARDRPLAYLPGSARYAFLYNRLEFLTLYRLQC